MKACVCIFTFLFQSVMKTKWKTRWQKKEYVCIITELYHSGSATQPYFLTLSSCPSFSPYRITCQVCQRNCQTREVLAYHAYTEHYVKLKEAKMCPFCCSSFTCLDDFLDHLDITNITFHCEVWLQKDLWGVTRRIWNGKSVQSIKV